MLCPIRWTGPVGTFRSTYRFSSAARAATPSVQLSRGTSTRLPPASSFSRMPGKYSLSVRPNATIRSYPHRPCTRTMGAASLGMAVAGTGVASIRPRR